tara:strand:+ start:309 stop:536 length:228 start_codon:yes stop_codon:yes gene_type:complete
MELTEQEQEEVFKAANSTVNQISECFITGSLDEAIELVVDANRISNMGGLAQETYDKLIQTDFFKLLRVNKTKWF